MFYITTRHGNLT